MLEMDYDAEEIYELFKEEGRKDRRRRERRIRGKEKDS